MKNESRLKKILFYAVKFLLLTVSNRNVLIIFHYGGEAMIWEGIVER